MEVRSIYKYARMSDQKVREVTRAVTGMPVSQAINVLAFTPKKAAKLVGKTLQAAIANAENNHELDADELFIKSATSSKGGMQKRIMPRARGSAGAIKKRMSHITVVLAKREAEETKAPAAKKEKANKAATPAPATQE
jgi:large subunit ribosomal protein L22